MPLAIVALSLALIWLWRETPTEDLMCTARVIDCSKIPNANPGPNQRHDVA